MIKINVIKVTTGILSPGYKTYQHFTIVSTSTGYTALNIIIVHTSEWILKPFIAFLTFLVPLLGKTINLTNIFPHRSQLNYVLNAWWHTTLKQYTFYTSWWDSHNEQVTVQKQHDTARCPVSLMLPKKKFFFI